MKILIVDDNREEYTELAQGLTRAYPGVQIEYAESALAAFPLLEAYGPDVIILDQVMGGGEKDGTAFLRRLGRERAGGTLPQIVFVTAHYREIPAWQILETGVPIALFLEKEGSFSQMLLRTRSIIT